MKNAGVRVDSLIYEGCYHAFEQVCPTANVSKRAFLFIEDAFRRAVDNCFAEQELPQN